jgi:hypothetical protein
MQHQKLQVEKAEKDHLLKELTSKNLEVLARMATLESTVVPMNLELKK